MEAGGAGVKLQLNGEQSPNTEATIYLPHRLAGGFPPNRRHMGKGVQ